MKKLLAILASFVALLFTLSAAAHGMRTAYVELRELDNNVVAVMVRSGATHGGVRVVMPAGCTVTANSSTYECSSPLAGSEIAIEGLGAVVGDAVVTAVLRDGSRPSHLLRPGAVRWTVPARASGVDAGVRYVRAGIVHVLSGADHLLFLAALVVMLRRFRAILLAETAFTVSHAVTMSCASLGIIHVPSAAAEAAIALSLVFVALDIGVEKATSPRAGALMALVFGAVHGLGFASGLEELGVGREAIVPALGGFAVGIEIAQVAFLVACFALYRAFARTRFSDAFTTATAYGVGISGFFWLVDRALPLVQSVFS